VARLVIATGVINRYNGIVQRREFGHQFTEAGVPSGVVRVKDQSKDTWRTWNCRDPSCPMR